jgi:hypothetical protein
MSPQSHFKKLVITQEDQMVFDSARKQQKQSAVLMDMSNDTAFPTSNFLPEEYSPYKPTHTSLPNSHKLNAQQSSAASSTLHKSGKSVLSDDDAMVAEGATGLSGSQNQAPLRLSNKGPGDTPSQLGNSFKPTPIRAQPSGR